MVEAIAPPEVTRSPEALQASPETVGVQVRLLHGGEALNPAKIDLALPSKDALSPASIEYAKIDAALGKKTHEYWKDTDPTKRKEEWMTRVQKRFSDYEEFWQGKKGKQWIETFKKIGFDPTNITNDMSALDTLYKTYRASSEKTATELFTDTIIQNYTKDGKLAYEQLLKEKEAITWLSGIIDSSGLDIVTEIIQARATFLKNPNALIQAATKTEQKDGKEILRVNNLREKEIAILTFIQEGSPPLTEPTPLPVPLPSDEETTPPDDAKPSTEENEEQTMLEKETQTFAVGEASEASPLHPNRNEDAVMSNTEKGFIGTFDGVGGSPMGEKASRMTRDAFAAALAELAENPTQQQVQEAMEKGWRDAITTLREFEATDKEYLDLGTDKPVATTASVVQYFTENGKRYAAILQAGDSRVYAVRKDGSVIQISQDDSIVTELVKDNKLTQEQAAAINFCFDEINGTTVTLDSLPEKTKAILDTISFPLTIDGETFADIKHLHRRINTMYKAIDSNGDLPTTTIAELGPNIAYLLTTSDGVHDNLTRSEIQATITGKTSPQEIADALVKETRRRFAIPVIEDGIIQRFEPIEVKTSRKKEDDVSAAVIKIPETTSQQKPNENEYKAAETIQLTPEEIQLYAEYMSYKELNDPTGTKSEQDLLNELDKKKFARYYVREFQLMMQAYGKEKLIQTADEQITKLTQLLQSVNIVPNPYSLNRSWFFWHAAKSRFLANNSQAQAELPNANEYKPFDPLAQFKPNVSTEDKKKSEAAMQEEVDTMLGWELHAKGRNGMDVLSYLRTDTPINIRDRIQSLLTEPTKPDGMLSTYKLAELGNLVRTYKRT